MRIIVVLGLQAPAGELGKHSYWSSSCTPRLPGQDGAGYLCNMMSLDYVAWGMLDGDYIDTQFKEGNATRCVKRAP